MFRPFVFVLALLAATQARAGAGMDQLDSFLDGLKTLAATFDQTVLNPENGSTTTFKGQFLLKRPGRFHWIYTEPYQQDIIADGRWVWLVDKDLEQVSQQSQDDALRGTPALVLLGNGDIHKAFAVTELGEHRGMQWLELTPRDKDGPFEQVRLGLADGMLQRMETRDRFGQVSHFVFRDMQRNLALKDDLFVYHPSPGMDTFAY